MARLHLPLLVMFAGCPRVPAPPSAPIPDGPYASYQIQWGDSLWALAERFHTPGGYPTLAALNQIADPHLIWEGDRLRIPMVEPATSGLPPWPVIQPFAGRFASCPAEVLPPPVASYRHDCEESACVEIDPTSRICSCRRARSPSTLSLTRMGLPLAQWEVSISPDPTALFFRFGTASDFQVVRADLDGHGRPELVVAMLESSDDLARSHWTVAILDGDTSEADPLTFEMDNWGAGTLVPGGPTGRCDLLQTEWTEAWEPARPWTGWYLLGRLLGYGDGALAPLPSQPLFARRLLRSDQNGTVPASPTLEVATPAVDLSSPETGLRRIEPMAERERAFVERGVVHAHREDGSLSIETTGRLVELVPGAAGQRGYARLGDAATGRLYPMDYQPRDADWLVGRQVAITTYLWEGYEYRNLVWVDPPA